MGKSATLTGVASQVIAQPLKFLKQKTLAIDVS